MRSCVYWTANTDPPGLAMKALVTSVYSTSFTGGTVLKLTPK